MALHTKKLNYRRNGVTEQINLYTTTAEVGAEYIVLRDGNTNVYAPIKTTTYALASNLRVFKNGVIKSIASSLLTPPAIGSTWLGGKYVGIYSGNYIIVAASDGGTTTWQGCVDSAAAATYNGYTDWILPDRGTLGHIINYYSTLGMSTSYTYASSTVSSGSAAYGQNWNNNKWIEGTYSKSSGSWRWRAIRTVSTTQ